PTWRHVEGARDVDGRPRRVVIEEACPRAELSAEIGHRYLAVGETQCGVERRRLESPRTVEVELRARLAVEGRHRLAGLESHDATWLILQREGGLEVRFASRRYEAACGCQRKKQKKWNGNHASAETPHHRLQGTRARLFG